MPPIALIIGLELWQPCDVSGKWPEIEELETMRPYLVNTGADVAVCLIQVQGIDYPQVSFQIETEPTSGGQLFVMPYDALAGKYELTGELFASNNCPNASLAAKTFTIIK